MLGECGDGGLRRGGNAGRRHQAGRRLGEARHQVGGHGRHLGHFGHVRQAGDLRQRGEFRKRRHGRRRRRDDADLADDDGRPALHDHAAMGRVVADARRVQPHDHDARRTLDDHVRRADADAHVGDAGGRKAADEHGRRAGRDDRAADMRDRNHRGRLHRADMHVGQAGGGRHGLAPAAFMLSQASARPCTGCARPLATAASSPAGPGLSRRARQTDLQAGRRQLPRCAKTAGSFRLGACVLDRPLFC